VNTIGDVLAELERHLFVGRQPEIERFRAWLLDPAAPTAILNVTGPGGIGKSTVLRAFRRIATDDGWSVRLVDGGAFRPTPDGLLQELGAGSVDEAVGALNHDRSLLLLDTFEVLTDLTRFLQEELLPRLSSDVKVVIAGRHELGRIWTQGSWHALIRPLPLNSLSAGESRRYLERRGVTRVETIEQMLRTAGGFPLALSLAADMAEHFGARDFSRAPEWQIVVHSLVERLMRDVSDPELRELLEAASVVRQFDEATLTALTGRPDVSAAFGRLCRLAVVRPGESGLLLHDDIRRVLANDLRWRHRERFVELRLRAASHFRERMRQAGPTEREWLLAERLSLWEHTLVQALAFDDLEPGEVWVEAARPEHLSELLTIQEVWQLRVLPALFPFTWTTEHDRESDNRFIADVASQPAARVRIARDSDGQGLGYSVLLPVSRETLGLLERNPTRLTFIRALWGDEPRLPLPDRAADSRIFFIVNLATGDVRPEATRAALIRDTLGALALGGVYLAATPLKPYQQLLTALGFSVMPEARNTVWSEAYPTEGMILDLRATGIEPWIEAIMAGRRPPLPLSRSELEQAIQQLLDGWHDDAVVLASPLAERLTTPLPGTSERENAERVRQALRAAMDRTIQQTSAEDGLAIQALTLAHVARDTSVEAAARQLAVSRSTFYRLLRRGVQALARALASP
jgi:hypothetical protein